MPSKLFVTVVVWANDVYLQRTCSTYSISTWTQWLLRNSSIKYYYLLIRVTWLFLTNQEAWIRALQKSTLKLFIASGFTSHVITFIHSDSFIFNFKTFEIGTPRLKSATGRHYLGSCAQHLFPEFKAKFHQLLLLEFFLFCSEERLRAEIFFLRFETEKWNGKKVFSSSK